MEGGNERLVDEDLKLLVVELYDAFVTLSGQLKKPNILLLGKTGAGKSSLVNAVFGEGFAAAGAGEPVTRTLERFAPEDKNVIIYDTKGLEHGNHEEFLAETKQFLMDLRTSQDLTLHLHVIWYIIDMSHARFQPFEEFICHNLFPEISVIFVLHKSDTTCPSHVELMKNLIQKSNFANCRGIYEVVSDRQNYQLEHCPVCFSEDIMFKHKSKEIICDSGSCMQRTKIGKTFGLELLVRGTIQQLPDFARYSFISAQEVDEKVRLRAAKEIICETTGTFRLKQSQSHRLSTMAVQLAILWGYKIFPSIAEEEVSTHFQNSFSNKGIFERLVLKIRNLLQSNARSEALVICIGIEVVRLLCELKMKAIGFVLREQNLPVEFDNIFDLDISNVWLEKISIELQKPENTVSQTVINLLQKRIAIQTSQEDWAE